MQATAKTKKVAPKTGTKVSKSPAKPAATGNDHNMDHFRSLIPRYSQSKEGGDESSTINQGYSVSCTKERRGSQEDSRPGHEEGRNGHAKITRQGIISHKEDHNKEDRSTRKEEDCKEVFTDQT